MKLTVFFLSIFLIMSFFNVLIFAQLPVGDYYYPNDPILENTEFVWDLFAIKDDGSPGLTIGLDKVEKLKLHLKFLKDFEIINYFDVLLNTTAYFDVYVTPENGSNQYSYFDIFSFPIKPNYQVLSNGSAYNIFEYQYTTNPELEEIIRFNDKGEVLFVNVTQSLSVVEYTKIELIYNSSNNSERDLLIDKTDERWDITTGLLNYRSFESFKTNAKSQTIKQGYDPNALPVTDLPTSSKTNQADESTAINSSNSIIDEDETPLQESTFYLMLFIRAIVVKQKRVHRIVRK